MKILLPLFVFHIALMYLTGAFIKGSLNSNLWEQSFKVLLVWAYAFSYLFCLAVYAMTIKDKEDKKGDSETI